MKGESPINRLSFERRLRQKGFNFIAGVDEVGRGPLAGPVYACAVILPAEFFHPAVRDSKRVSPDRRAELAGILAREALAVGIGRSEPAEIDTCNIRRASQKAMQRAVADLGIRPDFILIDGNDPPDFSVPARAIVGGDDKSFTIAAASIIAKVMRDELMINLDRMYPGYALDCNKGYGTAEHITALKMLGPTPLHRRSFLKRIILDTGAEG